MAPVVVRAVLLVAAVFCGPAVVGRAVPAAVAAGLSGGNQRQGNRQNRRAEQEAFHRKLLLLRSIEVL